jgi:ABC-type polysaccharide/polyol phosphate transport system ATPase subunit
MSAIEAHNLGKCYRKAGVGAPTLRDALKRAFLRRPMEDFWAVRGLTFKIEPGCTIGVIGANGSGKSSLLGLVAGTITPTAGTVRAHGRISSLLELGAGFHPNLSGRENVFLNAAILGIAREDVRKRFDAIVEFAGMRDFIDMPVKHYSSGMYVRLAFAVAVEMNPDVLLVDEVLSVGDAVFQTKCLNRIMDFKRRGKTILLVSHALETVEQFCDEVMLINKGQLVQRGPPGEVIFNYLRTYLARVGQLTVEEYGTREVEIRQVRLLDGAGQEAAKFTTGEPLHVEVTYHAHRRIENPVFGFGLKTGNGTYLFGSNTQILNYRIAAIEGTGVMRLTINPLTLMAGRFLLSLSIHSWDHSVQYHRQEDLYPFLVKDDPAHHGVVQLATQWELKPGP